MQHILFHSGIGIYLLISLVIAIPIAGFVLYRLYTIFVVGVLSFFLGKKLGKIFAFYFFVMFVIAISVTLYQHPEVFHQDWNIPIK